MSRWERQRWHLECSVKLKTLCIIIMRSTGLNFLTFLPGTLRKTNMDIVWNGLTKPQGRIKLVHKICNQAMSFRTNNILLTYKCIAASTSFFASPRYTQTSCNAHLKYNTNYLYVNKADCWRLQGVLWFLQSNCKVNNMYI